LFNNANLYSKHDFFFLKNIMSMGIVKRFNVLKIIMSMRII